MHMFKMDSEKNVVSCSCYLHRFYVSLLQIFCVCDVIKLFLKDRYFLPITSPTQARPNDDYYKGKYRQLQKEQEQYQATEASLNTEIERLRMELERKKDEIEYMKAEKQENYKSQDTSR